MPLSTEIEFNYFMLLAHNKYMIFVYIIVMKSNIKIIRIF